MNKTFLKQIEETLIAEKKRLEGELSRFAHRNPNTPEAKFEADYKDEGMDEEENANEVAQFSHNIALEGELEKALRDVDDALKLVKSGKYGICKYCKKEIDERRLLARPTSSSCIKCKKTLTQEV